MASDERWVLAYEHGPTHCRVPTGVRLRVGQSLLVGREGRLTLGVEVPDLGISREAVLVTALEDGWDIDVRNRRGAFVEPWGQFAQLVTGGAVLRWPRIAIRVLSGNRSPRVTHWVLLEADRLPIVSRGDGPREATSNQTEGPHTPAPLSRAQEEAVRLIFGPQLAWPPTRPAEPQTISYAARRLGIGDTAVRLRLQGARSRAETLGLSSTVEVTEADYLYVLVRAGYLEPPETVGYRCVADRLQAWLAAR
jgi:hypothetical protein